MHTGAEMKASSKPIFWARDYSLPLGAASLKIFAVVLIRELLVFNMFSSSTLTYYNNKDPAVQDSATAEMTADAAKHAAGLGRFGSPSSD